MLRKKLKLGEQKEDTATNDTNYPEANIASSVSITFELMFWEKIWRLEQQLCEELKQIEFSKSDKNIGAIYNTLDYAAEVHKNYLKQYLKKAPKVLFLGMNPGINGMGQTGVPFGHVLTVKNWMRLTGHVGKPDIEIPSKPVEGLDCTKEEPSGKRFWGLVQELCGQPENFFTNCFVHNICPFAFLHSSGRNITPTEIKGPAKAQLNAVCLKYLAQSIEVFNPQIIISIGSYANDRIKDLKKKNLISELIDCKLLAHPSPRSLNNNDWVDKARKWYQENDIIKYFNNERQ
ncbi:single-strand selective monofunctional uracil DNA glycosylase-like [Chironomus tepperi]|uniref:single-strand selective monofunctional uracil DNA glycosylase-like n=1 Tax=Chironomus tepperi TaxID=113505 RepID=UPI00391EFA71